MSENVTQLSTDVEKWIAQSSRCISVAKELKKSTFYAESCFYCHQASEMILKALLIKNGKLNSFATSNIKELLDLISSLKYLPMNKIEEVTLLVEKLYGYYDSTRYPDVNNAYVHNTFSEKDSAQAIENANAVYGILWRHVNKE